MKRRTGARGVLCGLLLAAPSAAGLAQTRPAAPDVRVIIDPARASAWTVDPRLFGRFFEHNGRDTYPGLYAQHLGNGSFEDWYVTRRGDRTEELFPAEPFPGIAHLWEPVWPGRGPIFWDRIGGGVNGRDFQRFVVGVAARAGVRQRVALPDRRTLEYELSLSVRGRGIDSLEARLRSADGATLATGTVPVTERWEERTLRLHLPRPAAARFGGSPFGEYALELIVRGTGEGAPHVDLDDVLLVDGDAVQGRYNLTTLAWLREFGVTTMRWPGGNWASAYRWRDGVGPRRQRPVRRNLVWGGLESNHFGTNEFLEFARLAGIEPLINVASNPEIPPAEAALWVEYVNGDTTTSMGRLRAAHGYPEPWNVRLWQVGNESYGPYQIGHVDAASFARLYREYHDAMKAVDPSITIIAAGADPGYVDFRGKEWNEALLDIAGWRVEAIDIHRYVNGLREAEQRRGWKPREYLQTHLVFPTQFERLVRELRESAALRGVPELAVSVGEWNANPRVDPGWPEMDYETMAHAAFVAGMFNAFLRQGDAVRYSYQRDNTLYFRPYRGDFRPPNPGAYTLRLYSDALRGGGSRHLPLEVAGPTIDTRAVGRRVRAMEDVPLVDAAAVLAKDGTRVLVFLTNRDLGRRRDAALRLADGWRVRGPAAAVLQWSRDPFAEQTSWEGPASFRVEDRVLEADASGALRVSLPPASVLRVELPVAPAATN